MIDHELKCYSEMFRELVTGSKKFDIRLNDRDFKRGQYIRLWETMEDKKTGWYLDGEIGYVLAGFAGLQAGYVAFTVNKNFFARDGMEDKRNLYQTYYEERGVYSSPDRELQIASVKQEVRPRPSTTDMQKIMDEAAEKKKYSKTKKKK